MAELVPPLSNFPGLTNKEGRKFINPFFRVGAIIYPQNDDPVITNRKNEGEGTIPIDIPTSLQSEGPRRPTPSIIGFQWNKTMGQASGQWQLTCKRNSFPFEEGAILDGDWIDIFVIRNGIKIPVCRGIVDTVRQQTMSVNGARVDTWNLTGRDHGSFFEYPITYSNIWLQSLTELSAGLFTQRVKGRIGGSPDELFRILIDATFKEANNSSTTAQWMLPSGLQKQTGAANLIRLLKVITFAAPDTNLPVLTKLRGAYYNEPQFWHQQGQALHQTLAQHTNIILNEYWYDLLLPPAFVPKNELGQFLPSISQEGEKLSPEGRKIVTSEEFDPDALFGQKQATLTPQVFAGSGSFGDISAIIRERPFPSRQFGLGQWKALPTWNLPSWMIESSDLGKGGSHERYNLFEIMSNIGIGSRQEQVVLSPPLFDRDSVRKFGFRSWQQNTRFVSADFGGVGNWIEDKNIWQEIIKDWFAINPYLRNGTISLGTLLPEIRIGQKIRINPGNIRDSEAFYVEGVNLNYQFAADGASPPRGRTSVTLTRGFKGTDDDLLTAVRNAGKNFEAIIKPV